MIARHLYLKICVTVSLGLVLFALLATMLWNYLGHDQFNEQLFAKSSSLTALLLPDDEADERSHQRVVDTVAREMDLGLTVYSADGTLLAASAEPLGYPDFVVEINTWHSAGGESVWATRLADGRLVMVDLDRVPRPSETIGIAISLGVLAVLISLLMYPFIRGLTGRLERLKEGVQRIGSGYLGERVEVEGRDEIAGLAISFNQAAEQIEKLLGSQRLLLANASHELRTPLTRIRLGIELLRKDTDSKRGVALEQDIRELDALINEIILITRLDAVDQKLVRQSLDFVALVAEECAHYPEATLDATQGELSGDDRMLRHLVRNLIDNAHKHGVPPVAVSIRKAGSELIFTVSDAGEGIAESDREQVFEPFYRAKNKQNIQGNGLGLALVQKIARAHNADILLAPPGISTVTVIFSEDL